MAVARLPDLTALDLGAAGAGLARRGFTARALTEAYLQRIATVDPRVNAYITVTADLALAQADASDRRRKRIGPLDGIPIALKDNIEVGGVPTTDGAGAARVADGDAAVVERLRNAGAVLLGKVNMDEGALGATTDNPHHGRTHNPWRHGFTAGSSSGGAGAAVAARLAIATLGTDTMGSVRLPAAYCGVVGLKPSYRQLSTVGVTALCARLDHVGVLARSVSDLRTVLSILSQSIGFEDNSSAVFLPRLRVGVPKDLDRLLELDVRRGFEQTLAALRRIGVAVEPLATRAGDLSAARRAGLLLCEAEAARTFERRLAYTSDTCSARFRAMLAYGRDAPRERLREAERRVQQAADDLRRMLERVDLLVTPTAPQTAFPFDAPTPVTQADLTAAANFAGCPAISLPSGLAPSGLPLATQFIARPGDERTLLALAGALEAAFAFRLPDLPRTTSDGGGQS